MQSTSNQKQNLVSHLENYFSLIHEVLEDCSTYACIKTVFVTLMTALGSVGYIEQPQIEHPHKGCIVGLTA